MVKTGLDPGLGVQRSLQDAEVGGRGRIESPSPIPFLIRPSPVLR